MKLYEPRRGLYWELGVGEVYFEDGEIVTVLPQDVPLASRDDVRSTDIGGEMTTQTQTMERVDRESGETESQFRAKLQAMGDKQLGEQCEHHIWLSAYANNNPRSAYHWKCDLTYEEASRRGKPEIYSRAHKLVSGR